MLNIYICEDDKEQLDVIKKSVKTAISSMKMTMRVALATHNPYDILNALKGNKFVNIYLLDIELNTDINGLKLAAKVRMLDPRGYIIFVTKYSEMSYLTFQYKVEAFEFVIKDEGEYCKKIREALYMIHERHRPSDFHEAVFSFRQNGKRTQVHEQINFQESVVTERFENIIAFEVSETVGMLYMIVKDRKIKFAATLKSLENKLDGRFFRCNSSTIVNVDKILKYDKKTHIILLENGKEFVISIKRIKDLQKRV